MAGMIVHEWLARTGGAERVVAEFAHMYPDAPITVLWSDGPEDIDPARISESWMSRTPLRRSKALALPFMLPTWRRLATPVTPDWVLVSSHLFAHHVRPHSRPLTPKLVYAHTPARYIWAPEHDARGASLPVRAASAVLKPLDRRRANEALSVAANSHFTRERIERAWRRDAEVIYPPVDVERIQSVAAWDEQLDEADATILESLPRDFLLGVSRFVPYKRLDLAIRAGVATGMPVVIVGSGPGERMLRRIAEETAAAVTFVIRPGDALLRAIYERAAALVFPAIEDFGIIPVEAMALGTPIVTSGIGGTSETVTHGVTGASLGGTDDDALARAVETALACDRRTVREHARRFDRTVFREHADRWITDALAHSSQG